MFTLHCHLRTTRSVTILKQSITIFIDHWSNLFQWCHNWSPYTQNRRLEDLGENDTATINSESKHSDKASHEEMVVKRRKDSTQDNENVAKSSTRTDPIQVQSNDKVDAPISLQSQTGRASWKKSPSQVGIVQPVQAQNSTHSFPLPSLYFGDKVKSQLSNDQPVQPAKSKPKALQRQDASEGEEMTRNVPIQMVDQGLESGHLI